MPDNINDALRAEESAGAIDSTPVQLAAIPTWNGDLASLKKTIQPIKAWIDARQGTSGSVMDKSLTLRDLVDAGAFALSVNNRVIAGDSNPVVLTPQDAKYNDPRPFYLTPPTLTNLTAVGAFKNVILTWDRPDYANHSYTEIWRATSNALGAASLVGTETSKSYADAGVLVGGTYYYWIRDVNSEGTHGAYNAVGGTSAALLTIGSTDLGPLTVTADKLSQGTYPNINLVPNPGAEDTLAGVPVSWTMVEGTAGAVASATLTVDSSIKTGGAQGFKSTKTLATDGVAYGCTAFPVIPGETYSVKVKLRGNVAGAAGLYIRMQELTSKPTTNYIGAIAGVDTRTSLTDFVSNGPVPAAFTAYEFSYTVPAGVFYAALSFYNWTTSTGTILYFDDISVGRQITASFLAANSIAVGTAAIQNAAIVNAMIANLAVDNAKIASLDGSKITANTVTAGQIAAGTITTHEIFVTAVTAASAASSTAASASFNSVTSGSVSAFNVVTLTTTGAPVTVLGFLDPNFFLNSTTIDSVTITVALSYDATALTSFVYTFKPPQTQVGGVNRKVAAFQIPISYQHTPAAGAHTWKIAVTYNWADIVGAAVTVPNPGGSATPSAYLLVQENKV